MSFAELQSFDASDSDHRKQELAPADHDPLEVSTRSHSRIEARMSSDHPQRTSPIPRKSLFGLSPFLSNDEYSSPFGGPQGGRRQPIILPPPSPSMPHRMPPQYTPPHGRYPEYSLGTISSSPTPYGEPPHHERLHYSQPSIGHPHALAPEPGTPPYTPHQQGSSGLALNSSSPPNVTGGDLTANITNPRKCKQCGLPGRYVDGKCIEKWGKGPLGRGSVCDRCRKKNKRMERLAELEKKNHENQRRMQSQASPAAGNSPSG